MEKITRKLTYVLRHAAKKMGLAIADDGFINLEEVLKTEPFKELGKVHPKEIAL